MSEEEPEAHRPRRAQSAPPDATEASSSTDPAGPSEPTEPSGPDRPDRPQEPGSPTEPSGSTETANAAATPPDEGAPRPLYRDETTEDGTEGRSDPADETSPVAASTDHDPSDETTILNRARERKRSRAQEDPDATTLLPRTAGGGRISRRDANDMDDDDDDIEADPTANRRRLLMMIGAVAVVAILGLVAGYAIIRTVSQPVAAPAPSSSPGGDPGASASTLESEPGSTALLTDALMLSAQQAATLDNKRTWRVALTQRGSSTETPHQPACLSPEVADGAPTPQQTVLRLLSSDGSDAPAALHQATAYGTPEEAAQAYAYAARSLGDCAMTGAWVSAGHLVGGVGDQATGVTIQVLDGDTSEFRTVVLSRTGRIVDVVDVAKPDRAVSATRVAKAAGAVLDTQCSVAGGSCSDEPEAQDGPPPLGGDQPGFLASGDLPPEGEDLARWAGTTPSEPDQDLLRGSGCETVNWSKVEAESASHRTYLLSDGSNRFGLDEVVVTAANEAAATKLAEKVRDDWKNCGGRQLTASVSTIAEVEGPGAQSVDVRGWTTQVTQKADNKTTAYRVGIVTAGPKVAFLFLNPQPDLDLTPEQFDTVTVRAGQRATQIN